MSRQKLFDEFVLGQDARCRFTADTHVTQCNNNILVVGGTGSGKTTSVSEPLLLHMKHTNPIVSISKKDLFDEVAPVLRRRGYQVNVIDFTGVMPDSLIFDPLAACLTEQDVSNLAKSIAWAEAGGNTRIQDPYWYTMPQEMLETILLMVYKGYYGERSMQCVLDIVNRLDGSAGVEIDPLGDEESKAEKFRKHPFDHAVIQHKEDEPALYHCWIEGFRHNADNTRHCLYSTFKSQMDAVFNSAIRRDIKTGKTFSFSSLLQPRTALFIYNSPVDPTQKTLLSLFYSQLLRQLFLYAERQQDGVLPVPVQLICDDFATGMPIPEFSRYLSVFRAKGISALLLIQSETQLCSLYGRSEAQTIINNCDTYIYLGGMDVQTCQSVALRFDMPMAEVLQMPVGRELYFHRGQRPVSTKRLNLYEDSVYCSLVRAPSSQREQ